MLKRRIFLVLTAALALLLAGDSWAKKGGKPGGGGGGGGPAPGGTIYFWSDSDEDGSFDELRSASPDGTNDAAVFAMAFFADDASYQLHGGRRWFLQARSETELYAKADDGQLVKLVEEPGLLMTSQMAWAKDDSFVSFVGVDTADTHIFRVSVDWSTGAPVANGSLEVIVTEAGATYQWEPSLRYLDWSTAGDKVVYGIHYSGNDAHVCITEVGGATTDLGVEGRYMRWAPDGSRIAYDKLDGFGLDGIWTIDPDGTGATQLTSPNGRHSHWHPSWSPDSAHLAFWSVRQGVARIEVAAGNVTIVRSGAARPFAWR